MVNARNASYIIIAGIIIHGAGRNVRWFIDEEAWLTINRITEALATVFYAWAINNLGCRTQARLASEYLLILSIINVLFIVLAVPTRFNIANYLAALLVTVLYVKYFRQERRLRRKNMIP